jgi:hypothetical protein
VVFDMDTILKVVATLGYDWTEMLSLEEDNSATEVTDN